MDNDFISSFCVPGGRVPRADTETFAPGAVSAVDSGSSGATSVQVFVRVRPVAGATTDVSPCVRVLDDNKVQAREALYNFHKTFGPAASQDDVYSAAVRRCVQSAMDGLHSTVFACVGRPTCRRHPRMYSCVGYVQVRTDRLWQDLHHARGRESEAWPCA